MISIPDFNDRTELSQLLERATRQGGVNRELKKEDIEKIIGSHIADDTIQKARAVLSDDKKMRALFESEAARELLKKFGGGGFNG